MLDTLENAQQEEFRTKMKIFPDKTMTAEDTEQFSRLWRKLGVMLHDNSVSKGFWDKPRNDGEALMLIVSELSEGLEALRHGNPPSDHIPTFSGVEEELADVIIRLMEFSTGRGWRIVDALFEKMKFNATRPKMHGKSF